MFQIKSNFTKTSNESINLFRLNIMNISIYSLILIVSNIEQAAFQQKWHICNHFLMRI